VRRVERRFYVLAGIDEADEPTWLGYVKALLVCLPQQTLSAARSEFAPAILFHIDAVIVGGLLDVGEGKLAVGIRNVLDLIEAGERINHMTGVGQRLFPLPREGEHALWQLRAIVNLAIFRAWDPSGLCGHY
jgi:hypothetical protein